jgi:hypothetical protein
MLNMEGFIEEEQDTVKESYFSNLAETSIKYICSELEKLSDIKPIIVKKYY